MKKKVETFLFKIKISFFSAPKFNEERWYRTNFSESFRIALWDGVKEVFLPVSYDRLLARVIRVHH